ncbi:MAG: hypothetical protein V2I97_21490 [Desulfococcaceae bacterium]|jgi:hypothetical protein|nr:hypothetical protein [Desulfococcaceae bacterium]
MQAIEYTDISYAEIPEVLIYEISEGKAVYYRDYKDYLRGEKSPEELMGSSYLQVFVIMKIMKHLLIHLPDTYHVFTNELGVIVKEGCRRSIDIAVYS